MNMTPFATARAAALALACLRLSHHTAGACA